MTMLKNRSHPARMLLAALCVVALNADGVRAVGPSHWVHTSEADFENGTFTNVVATNFGDLKLSRAVKILLEQDARVSAVYAMVQAPDGTVYAATGPRGTLLAIKDEKVTDAAVIADGSNIFSLALDKNGAVLMGTGGETGKVYRLEKAGAEPKEIFAVEDVQYVWAIQALPDGTLYFATGPNGQLFELKPGGKPEVILDSNENNLLSMAADGKDLLYVGTDPNGLVYRVNRKTRETFVIHDAAESEITTLALAANGTLYAGTAEAVDAMMPAETGEEAIGGRPESGTGAMPIPSQPPEEPQPPETPDPNPGEPDPIPKKPADAEPQAARRAVNQPAVFWHSQKPSVSLALQQEPSPPDAPEPPPGMPGAPDPTTAVAPVAPGPPGMTSEDAGVPRAGGNAVYRIDSSGFVTEIFREPVLVLSMIEKDGILTLGTGSEGRVYQLNPAAEETVVLAKLEPKQVMAMCPTSDGRLLLGLANTGGIAVMTPGYATSGNYVSAVLDASQISRFGQLHLHGRLPEGTELLVATRSGNLSEPQETGWSKWTDDAPAMEFLKIESPAARFLQYRLTFKSADGKSTAVVDEADVAYQLPNLPPKVTSITAASADGDAAMLAGSGTQGSRGSGKQTISWVAEDPNLDGLRYSIQFRSGSRAPWVLLKDDISETSYEWDTHTVADGRYEVRIMVSDRLANPAEQGRSASRISDPISVDNTAPVLSDLKAEVKEKGVTITARASDRTSPLHSFEYSVDSSKDWQSVLPSDSICDGPEESIDFSVSGLKPGAHQVAVRATDARGNQAVRTVTVTVEPPPAQ